MITCEVIRINIEQLCIVKNNYVSSLFEKLRIFISAFRKLLFLSCSLQKNCSTWSLFQWCVIMLLIILERYFQLKIEEIILQNFVSHINSSIFSLNLHIYAMIDNAMIFLSHCILTRDGIPSGMDSLLWSVQSAIRLHPICPDRSCPGLSGPVNGYIRYTAVLTVIIRTTFTAQICLPSSTWFVFL